MMLMIIPFIILAHVPKYFRLWISSIHQAQLAPAPGAGAWPIVVFSHGMGCNRFAYSKVQYL